MGYRTRVSTALSHLKFTAESKIKGNVIKLDKIEEKNKLFDCWEEAGYSDLVTKQELQPFPF